MASFDHHLNPLFSIKECMTCGALYTADFCCSKGGFEDKILVPKPPQNCATCGNPVDGLYCRSCAFVQRCLNEGWYTIHDENEILNTSESSNHNTNVFPVNYPPQKTSKEIFQAREDLMEAIQAFLKEYDHIPPNEKCMALLLAEERFLKIKQVMREEQNQPEVMQELLLKLMDDLQILKGSQQEKKETFSPIPFGVTPKVILIAWERFGKIKDALMDEQYQQEDIQELMSKLFEDVQNIREELKPTAITPDIPIEEPDNSLSMGDEHLDTILSVENLVPIPSELEGISEDMCDMPVGEDSSTFDALRDHSEILSDSNNVGTSSDDDPYENIEYVEALPLNLEIVSLEEVNKDQEEKEFDLEDIWGDEIDVEEDDDSFQLSI
ncbi:hypothetical protein Tco_1020539 [Tanacetum coccineum]